MGNTWTHLFTDGAVTISDGSASARGVLWDQQVNWILGFNHYLERCSVFKAELWGILDGLLVFLSKKFRRVTIQSDNLEVVKALQESWLTDSDITMFRRIRRILKVEGQW
ncbi:hypothetical protein Goari_024144 [Gossypium aridum]|uniref:RNase H type-1 domain-containing protein n=1 Tax=Gossypium aridum TaxID=34290 RepID=A0A7J8X579_GOSAI|nr:hypothetical protein [Gossypium aridum]